MAPNDNMKRVQKFAQDSNCNKTHNNILIYLTSIIDYMHQGKKWRKIKFFIMLIHYTKQVIILEL